MKRVSDDDAHRFLIDKFSMDRWEAGTGRAKTLRSTSKSGFDDRLSFTVGGLEKEIKEIRRRVLLSRQLDKKMMETLGISHVKGLLLYG